MIALARLFFELYKKRRNFIYIKTRRFKLFSFKFLFSCV
ncbi:hypothetical protein CSUNSWCD_862 [Campylobacter showae CSUNSWCD]|uniref:Uncharacterized protein n=1 Tax=Campylobacter showae CSUNSWCD TaxID=1244083 RepID=M5IPC3_9BACT|nr:hypothetical protein CSUNSWCD_862 [Campylobacter showae CSUNSWCD]